MATIDRKVSGQRGKGRRIQPYAWLGAGALTLGLGAAMASGTAIAHADDGSDAGNSGVSKSQSSTRAMPVERPKHSTSSSAAAGSAARKAQKNSASGTAEAADTTAPAATAVSSDAAQPLVRSKAAVTLGRRDRRRSAGGARTSIGRAVRADPAAVPCTDPNQRSAVHSRRHRSGRRMCSWRSRRSAQRRRR